MSSQPDDRVIVTVAVTGSFGDRSTPNLPITPREIAASALEAYRSGAAVAHIHVRDTATGLPSMELALYREVVERIRDHSDMLINLSTGAGARFAPTDEDPVSAGPGSSLCPPQRRVEHVLALQPELCSLDVGSMNFGAHAFVNSLPHVETMASHIRQAGVTPEIEVFDLGQIEIARHLLQQGLICRPPLFQFCMGVRWGIPATVDNMQKMARSLPADALWGAFGVGAAAYPMLAQTILLGGNVRTGLEDNLYLQKGLRATSNQQLIAKAVDIIRVLDKTPASPRESRRMLGLDTPGNQDRHLELVD